MLRAAPVVKLRVDSPGGIVVKRTSLLVSALLSLAGVTGAFSQERQITGRVTSAATAEPVAGVNVSVTGTAFVAVTNADGRYAIAAPASAVTLARRRASSGATPRSRPRW
jgi:thymidine phosphorylase